MTVMEPVRLDFLEFSCAPVDPPGAILDNFAPDRTPFQTYL